MNYYTLTSACLDNMLSIEDALATLSNGSFKPELEPDDEPIWAQALASPEREYWIAGGHDELKSLEDLSVTSWNRSIYFSYFNPMLTPFLMRLMVTHRLDSCDHLLYRLMTWYVPMSLLLL